MFVMPDFDIILGMNFLSCQGVKINYKKKKVQFQLDNSEEFTFGKVCILSMMISRVKARKMLSKRCIGCLAHIMNKVDKSIPSLQSTPIICQFQDIFPNNLPELASKREVEFNINLALQIVELQELKKQL